MKTYSRHDFTGEERAARSKVAISAAFESEEQAFLDFLRREVVDRLREKSISACLGEPRPIRLRAKWLNPQTRTR